MSNLTTTNGFSPLEVEAMQKLTEYQKYFIQVKNEPKIIHLEKQDVLSKIYALIIKTIEISGESKKYNLDNLQTKNVASFIYDMILDHYKSLTLSEVQNAFNLGLTGEFGQYVGYGTVTFSKFIKGYMTLPKREQAIKEWLKYQNEPKTTQVPVTKFFQKNMEIAKYFFSICKEKESERFGIIINHDDNVMHLPAIYDFIYQNYQISFSDESIEIITKKAKIKYNNYINKSGLKTYDESGYKNIINSVKFGENRTFEYYQKTQALIFLTLKLKDQNKTYDNLKPL